MNHLPKILNTLKEKNMEKSKSANILGYQNQVNGVMPNLSKS